MNFVYKIIIEFVLKKLIAFGYWLFIWKRQEKIGDELAKAHDDAIKKGNDNEIEKSGADVLNGGKS